MDEYKAIAELVSSIGVAGILLYLLLVQYRRYDDLGERLGKRLDEVAEKRVEDNKQAAVMVEHMLDLVAKVTENTAKQAKDIAELGEALVDVVRKQHETAGETTIREMRKPRGNAASKD